MPFFAVKHYLKLFIFCNAYRLLILIMKAYVMNTLVIVLIAAVLLSAAYVLYGRWLANKWGIDPKAETPAKKFEDGKRQYQVLYVPLLHWHLQSGRRCTYRICQYLATVRICQPVTVRTGRKNHRTCQSLL